MILRFIGNPNGYHNIQVSKQPSRQAISIRQTRSPQQGLTITCIISLEYYHDIGQKTIETRNIKRRNRDQKLWGSIPPALGREGGLWNLRLWKPFKTNISS
ncbi:Protein dip1 [Fusarium oxysporum f. sp. albedinis]|nr:Protein dip1 [Fusarium oxysporum f. sp. albedinis]